MSQTQEEQIAELQAKLIWQKAAYELPLGPDNDDDDRRWAYEAYYRTVLNLRALGVKVV